MNNFYQQACSIVESDWGWTENIFGFPTEATPLLAMEYTVKITLVSQAIFPFNQFWFWVSKHTEKTSLFKKCLLSGSGTQLVLKFTVLTLSMDIKILRYRLFSREAMQPMLIKQFNLLVIFPTYLSVDSVYLVISCFNMTAIITFEACILLLAPSDTICTLEVLFTLSVSITGAFVIYFFDTWWK